MLHSSPNRQRVLAITPYQQMYIKWSLMSVISTIDKLDNSINCPVADKQNRVQFSTPFSHDLCIIACNIARAS